MKDEDLCKASYWDERYAQAQAQAQAGDNSNASGQGDQNANAGPTHEWFKGFASLKQPFLDKYLIGRWPPERYSDLRILHLGSGDSTVPIELLALGYKRQSCIDFSSVVISKMAAQYADKDGLIEWIHGDVRDMRSSGIEDNSIDVAFDKGTLDAMISGSPWDPPAQVRENVGRYLDEVARVLRPGGVFLYVTFRQPHFMRPLLTRDQTWSLHLEELNDEQGGSFGYFGWVMEKKEEKQHNDDHDNNNGNGN
ncbi:hypothetical protein ABEF95_006850 [Exophiala dermatitidis]